MHGKVSAAVEHGLFQFLDEKCLATDFGQGHVKDFVTLGFDTQQLHRDVFVHALKFRLDEFGLP